jgi:hypothetical protein
MKNSWKILVLWIVVIGVIAWFVVPSETFQSCINASNNQAAEKTSQNNISGFSVSLGIYRDCLGYFVHATHDEITALSTLFIALFTLTLWTSTHSLWKAGELHGERELRAYIAAIPAGIQQINPNDRLIVQYAIQNGGATPAHDVEQVAVLRILPYPLPANTRFPVLPQDRTSKFVIPRGVNYGGAAIADYQFTQNQIVEIFQAPAQGGNRLYIFGQLDYVDAFRRPRWTRFCASYTGNHDVVPLAQQGNWNAIAQIIRQPSFAVSFEFANQHNDSK